MADQTFRVVLTGGGSGGHVYPLLAVAEALQEKAKTMQFPLELTYLGPKDSYLPLFQDHGIAVSPVAAGKIRRYLSFENIMDVPKFFAGFAQALWKLFLIMPDVVFSKGGTGAFPVVLAAWFYRIPVAIHDSDAKPGLTNIASGFFAKKVFIGFDAAQKYFNPSITTRTGVPVRKELFANPTTKELAKEALGFDGQKPLTLVIGGSQGSENLNNFILSNLAKIMNETQVLHQTGAANFQDVDRLSQAALIDASFANRYQALAYLDDKNYELAFTAADLIVSRAGSGTLFEAAAFGIPLILIPHDGGSNGHQKMNAYDFAKSGGAIVIEEPNFLPGIFMAQLKSILSNQELREKMSVASKKFFIPNAESVIVDGIMQMAIK